MEQRISVFQKIAQVARFTERLQTSTLTDRLLTSSLVIDCCARNIAVLRSGILRVDLHWVGHKKSAGPSASVPRLSHASPMRLTMRFPILH